MARKKPPLSLRKPADLVDPQQAERFVRGLVPDPPGVPEPRRPEVQTSRSPDAPEPRRPEVQAPRSQDAQASQRPDAPTSRGPDVQTSVMASRSLVYRKRTDDVRRRMTIYLSEDLSRRLRLYAAEKDQDYSLVLAEALDALLTRRGVH